MTTATANGKIGRITQVIGSTFDAEFEEENLPAIYNAVKIQSNKKGVEIDLTGEVQQHLGGGRVRCVALGSTDGLIRGQDVRDTLVGLVHDLLESGARGSDEITPTAAGGFSVVLDNCVLDGALVWAERVRARLREIRALGNGEAVTACFGVAELHAGEAADGALERAAAALRIARSDGRDKLRAAR